MANRARVEPAGIELDVGADETLIEAAWRAGYEWPTVCHGMGSCRACAVTVVGPGGGLVPPTRFEGEAIATLVAAGGAAPGEVVRLACQARLQGDVVVSKYGVRLAGQPAEEKQ